MRVFDVIFFASGIIAFIALPFWIIFAWPIWTSKSKEAPARWRELIADTSTVLFIGSILIGLAAASTSQDIAHKEVVAKLKSFSDEASISVNGAPAGGSKELLDVLRSVEWLPPHHSHPTQRIRIDISDRGSRVVLSLGRDSSDPREYWVFYPNHNITRENDIGRVKTSLFDSY